MKIFIGSDHAGFELKEVLVKYLGTKNYDLIDFGTHSTKSVDYPDFAYKVATEVVKTPDSRGILICGSGVGVTVASNKVKGIRACLCHDSFSARQGVEDDNLNVLCLGARIIGYELAKIIVMSFLDASFSNIDRHVKRCNKVLAIEQNNFKLSEGGLS